MIASGKAAGRKPKTVDLCSAIIAPVGYGKTTYLLGLAWQAAAWAHVWLHDSRCNVVDKLPDGTRLDVVRVDDSAAAEKISRKDPGRRLIVVVEREDPEEIVDRAVAFADEGLRKGPSIPVVVAIDEASAWTPASRLSGELSPPLKKLLGERRHYHCGFLLGSQSAQGIHRGVRLLCREIHLGRVTAAIQLDALIAGGVHPVDARLASEQEEDSHGFRICRPNRDPPEIRGLEAEVIADLTGRGGNRIPIRAGMSPDEVRAAWRSAKGRLL